jgi:hypothetical protein
LPTAVSWLFRLLLTVKAFDLPEKKDQPFGDCRLSENRIAQHGKRHSPDHRSFERRPSVRSLRRQMR